jgi:hypothetical protein
MRVKRAEALGLFGDERVAHSSTHVWCLLCGSYLKVSSMSAYFTNLLAGTRSHLHSKHASREAADAILANYNVPELGRVADRPKLTGTALELVKNATVPFVADPNIPRTADIRDGGEEIGTKTPHSSLFGSDHDLSGYDFMFGSTFGSGAGSTVDDSTVGDSTQ